MRFFLNNSFYIISVIISLALWGLGFYKFLALYLLVVIMVSFFHRRISPHHQEDYFLKEGVFYAPVNGRVKSIKQGVEHPKFGKDLTEVTFTISWLREAGLYFPTGSEVLELFYEKGKSFFRYFFDIEHSALEKYSGVYLKLKSTNSEQKEYGIQVVKCILGSWPKVRVVPGDRGRAQVNFGFLGLGGTVLLYLPSQCEILVKNSQLAIAGQTIIAARLDESGNANTQLNEES